MYKLSFRLPMHCCQNIIGLVKKCLFELQIDCFRGKNGESWLTKTALSLRGANFFWIFLCWVAKRSNKTVWNWLFDLMQSRKNNVKIVKNDIFGGKTRLQNNQKLSKFDFLIIILFQCSPFYKIIPILLCLGCTEKGS
jgi:hypothetical protein